MQCLKIIVSTTEELKLRGVSYLGSKFDVHLSKGKACFRAWLPTTGLKIGVLDSSRSSYVALSVTPTCYDLETSIRIFGSSSA